MFGWYRRHQAEKASRIVIRHVCRIKQNAAELESANIRNHHAGHGNAHYMLAARTPLSTLHLERLLHTDFAGVMAWANNLPKVRLMLHPHGMQLVPASTEFPSKRSHLMTIDQTANAMHPAARTGR